MSDEHLYNKIRVEARPMVDTVWQKTKGQSEFPASTGSAPKVLSAKEERAILMQFARSRGKKGFTNEECAGLLSEAAAIRLKNDMLSLVIAGLLVCDWNGNAMTLPPLSGVA